MNMMMYFVAMPAQRDTILNIRAVGNLGDVEMHEAERDSGISRGKILIQWGWKSQEGELDHVRKSGCVGISLVYVSCTVCLSVVCIYLLTYCQEGSPSAASYASVSPLSPILLITWCVLRLPGCTTVYRVKHPPVRSL
jgi:hypothetical protein